MLHRGTHALWALRQVSLSVEFAVVLASLATVTSKNTVKPVLRGHLKKTPQNMFSRPIIA